MIRVGIIGTGNISGAHISAYQAFPERCHIVALADITEEKMRQACAKHSLQSVALYNDPLTMLEKESLDLVSICTPPSSHAALTVASVESGSHVLVEKPMAGSLQECDIMIEAQKRTNRKISVVAQNRFVTPMWNLKKIVETELAGKILHTQVNSYWWRGHSYYDQWWRGTWKTEGGGCTLNHAVHHIDMMLYLVGMPTHVYAILGNVSHDNSEVEDLSMALLTFPNNRYGQVTSSVVHHGEKQEIILQCERARVGIPWEVSAMSSAPNGFPNNNTELEELLQQKYKEFGSLKYERHAGQIDNMLGAIEQDIEPLVTSVDGRNALEVITAVYASGSLHTQASLPISPDHPFYTSDGVDTHAIHFYKKQKSIELDSYGEISLGSSYKTTT